MENKKEEKNTWKLILKIFFILFSLAFILLGGWMAFCWWFFLFEVLELQLKWIAILSLLWGIMLIIISIYFIKNINFILKKIFNKNNKNDLL